MQIKLTKIKFDERLQNRVKIDTDTVKEYSDAIDAGISFPDVTVFFDGSDYWLADGFHRYHAHNKLGVLEINADVRNGTLREAILFSVGVNAAHGLRRTNADKRKAVFTLLNDEEWNRLSDREIARLCAVSNNFVSELRKSSLSSDDSDVSSICRTYTTKHGTQAVMNTANIGGKSNNHQENKSNKNNKLEDEILEKEISDQETYGDFDPITELEQANKEIDRLTKIVESDDQLAEANKEIKRLASLCETQQFRINSLMSEKAEAVRYAKKYKSMLDSLEKKVSKADLVDF